MSWMTMTFTSIPKGAHHDRASTHSQGYATAAVSVTVNSGGFVRVTSIALQFLPPNLAAVAEQKLDKGAQQDA